jgi:hypothetical protein
MASGIKALAIDLRKSTVRAGRYEALLELLSSSSTEMLESLVHKAMDHFEAGSDPDVVYKQFDIARFAGLLVLDRKSAAKALSGFKDRSGEEKLAACLFVSMALIAINNADPHFARLALGHIIRSGSHEPEMRDLSKLVMLGIVQTVYGMEEPGSPMVSFANCCLKRLNE